MPTLDKVKRLILYLDAAADEDGTQIFSDLRELLKSNEINPTALVQTKEIRRR
jgi:hypothetical protein